MKNIAVILTVSTALLLAGCRTYSESVMPVAATKTVPTPSGPMTVELSDKEKIDLLRAEAHKRGLKWKVYCMDWTDDNHRFMGEAAPKGGAFSTYREEGSKGVWLEEGDTQANVAFALYQSIQGPQTHPAETKEVPSAHNQQHKYCPPELRGE